MIIEFKKQNKLEELLKETAYTQEEWATYKKVEKNCRLEDLKSVIEDEEFTQKELEIIYNNIETILHRFNKALEWNECSWYENMRFAIVSVLEDSNS